MPNVPDKPPHGAPCNGCGVCCHREPCPLGAMLFDVHTGRCPGLAGPIETTAGDSSYYCGLVAHPECYAPVAAALHGREALREAAKLLIGAGTGCDAQCGDEPYDDAFGRKLRWIARKRKRLVERSLMLWGLATAYQVVNGGK